MKLSEIFQEIEETQTDFFKRSYWDGIPIIPHILVWENPDKIRLPEKWTIQTARNHIITLKPEQKGIEQKQKPQATQPEADMTKISLEHFQTGKTQWQEWICTQTGQVKHSFGTKTEETKWEK